MAKANKATANKIDDFASQTDSPPSENAGSIIITKRPLMSDPMMTAPNDGSAPKPTTPSDNAAKPADAGPLSVTHQLVITPPTRSEPPQPAVAEAPKPVAEPESNVPATTSELTDVSVTTVEPKPEALNQEAAEAQAEDVLAKRQAEIAALVESQQYFLPVDGVELKRARYFVALGGLLIVGLALIWADLTLDAGLLSVEGVPHTTFFQQVSSADQTAAVAPMSQTYSAPISKYIIRLPASWKLDGSKSTAAQDNLTATTASNSAAAANSKVVFASGPSLAATDIVATIDTVHYQKLAHTKGTATYLQELVYHTDQTHFNVIANVVNDNKLKIGDSLKNLTPTFYTSEPTSVSQLCILTSPGTGFASSAAVQKYMQLNAYQQARAGLLSLSSPAPNLLKQ